MLFGAASSVRLGDVPAPKCVLMQLPVRSLFIFCTCPRFPLPHLPALPPLRRGKWLEMAKARVPSTLAPIMPAKGKTGQGRQAAGSEGAHHYPIPVPNERTHKMNNTGAVAPSMGGASTLPCALRAFGNDLRTKLLPPPSSSAGQKPPPAPPNITRNGAWVVRVNLFTHSACVENPRVIFIILWGKEAGGIGPRSPFLGGRSMPMSEVRRGAPVGVSHKWAPPLFCLSFVFNTRDKVSNCSSVKHGTMRPEGTSSSIARPAATVLSIIIFFFI